MPDIEITAAGISDLPVIRDIAYHTWPVTYGSILSKAQLDFMLDQFYSFATLSENIDKNNHKFAIASDAGIPLGFVSYEHHYLGKDATRIHKLYMLPELQGRGIGKALLEYAENHAKAAGSDILSLNVNRFNKAQHFYLKHGFTIAFEENIDIGNGYLMEDYRMEKSLVR